MTQVDDFLQIFRKLKNFPQHIVFPIRSHIVGNLILKKILNFCEKYYAPKNSSISVGPILK